MSKNVETMVPPPNDYGETDSAESRENSKPISENVPNPLESLTPESVYEFYVQELFPALLSSFPILMHRLWKDALSYALLAGQEFLLFIQPKWMKDRKLMLPGDDEDDWMRGPNGFAQHIWEHAVQSSKNVNTTIADFMLYHFDKDNDGHISPNELLNMTEIFLKMDSINQQERVDSFWAWFSREWPLMDLKIGVFLWQTFGGLLLVVAAMSVMPGRLHTWSGKVLRWPILGLTYLLINIELVVYIAIRLVIRLIETLVANPKHRALRYKMANASSSYKEWYEYAAELDRSQKRNLWQSTTNDETCYQYNWQLIKQLLNDMREARVVKKDPILALAVLQQCTRKNVGGIMNEDLFTKTYTGEPKFIVIEFINEVTLTLKWVTNQTLRLEEEENIRASEAERQGSLSYEKHFQRKTIMERQKLWSSLVSFATLDFGVNNNDTRAYNKSDSSVEDAFPKKIPPSPAESLKSSKTNETKSSILSSSSSIPPLTRQQLLRFLKRARHAYGKTALCLSGGAMMGLYHLGHLKGLMETDCIPNIVSGCSAGSAIGAVICTRTNEEIERDLVAEVICPRLKCFARSWPDRIKSVLKEGNLFSGEEWLQMIKWFTCGDMTFEEAYKKTGRVFCIALSATAKKTPPILINYISAPNVTIASAVVASAAVPGFVSPQRLMCKDPDGTVRCAGPETYYDGSIRHDIPTEGLSEMLNCHFFVACQCNPHIVPFFFNPKGGVGQPSRWSGGEQETSWRGGFLLAALEMYLKNDMRAKFVFLRDLDAALSFTGTMMTQSFVGTTTIVPKVELLDFFNLFRDPTLPRIYHYMKVGSVAAYQHAAMIRCHYRVADALEECIEKLGGGHIASGIQESPMKKTSNRRSSFEVGELVFRDGDVPTPNSRRRIWSNDTKAEPARNGVPEIISSRVSSGDASSKRLKVGDSDSLSTASETYAPNI